MSFKESLRTEELGEEVMLPILRQMSDHGTVKQITDKDGQRYSGDWISCIDGEQKTHEFKTVNGYYDAFFIEFYSNRQRGKFSWLVDLGCDYLWYLYLANKALFIIDMPRLQWWLLTRRGALLYDLIKQEACEQMNDTWGMKVPHADVRRIIGFVREPPRAPEKWIQMELAKIPPFWRRQRGYAGAEISDGNAEAEEEGGSSGGNGEMA